MITSQLLDKVNKELDAEEHISEQFPLDNTYHHFKNGKKEPSSSHIWCIGTEWEYKGNSYQSVTVGDWRSGHHSTVKSYDPTAETKSSLGYAKKYIEEKEKAIKDRKEETHKECKDKWEPIFNDCMVKSPRHEYLRHKKIKENYRARMRGESTLLVPIENPKFGFVGCQQIFKKDNKFLKFFTKGIRIQGSYSRLTNFDLKNEKLIYLAEGFATAASVYEATGKPVVICFNCNNIIPAIASIRSVNKSVKIVIAGDDDHEVIKPKNPGRHHADQATKQFSNCVSRFPKFQTPDGLSDFNDLHITESIEKVTEQLSISNSEFIEIRLLGHKSGRFYYVNSQTSEILNLTAANHSPDNLMAQAPRKYWGQKYGYKKDKEGSPTLSPDWDLVKEKLFDYQRTQGFFDSEKIRGIGGWIDSGKIVFNSGKHLFIDGEKLPISEHTLQTQFVYEASKNIDLDLSIQPTQDDIDQLIKCFELVNYKNPADYIYLLGIIILAQTPGLWTWRPHSWLSGPRGSGKSTILYWLDNLIFTNQTGIIENATAAGIRGELGYSAVSCIIDEAEASTVESKRRMAQVMELARQSSSNTGSKTLRGTATGESVSYMLNSLFIMGSIQTSLNNAADNSRFTVIELLKGDPTKFSIMQKIAQDFPALKKKLLAFAITHARLIQESQTICKQALIDFNSAIDARLADQLSWSIAAFYVLKYKKVPTEFRLDALFVALNINDSDYIAENQSDDEGDCLGAILDILTHERNSIYHCISKTKPEELAPLGIRVIKKHDDDNYDVFFAAKSPGLRKALQDTEFHDYAKMLRRLPQCTVANRTHRVNGNVKKGLVLSINISNKLDAISRDYAPSHENDVPF